MVGKPFELRGEMECEVYLDTQDIRVPLEGREPIDVKELGGFKISTELVREEESFKVKYGVTWKLGMSAEDSERLKKLLIGAKPNEVEAGIDWMTAKSADLRLLGVQKAEVINQEGKVIAPLGREVLQMLDIRGNITVPNTSEPKELRLRLCERKVAIVVFEFKGGIADKWQQ